MSAPIHVGVDVDGVIADFNAGFMDLFEWLTKEDRFGKPRPAINTWNYSTDQFGYTKDQDRAAWKAVMASGSFWRDLPPYKDTLEFLTTLRLMPVRVTFITSRVGQDVLGQTQSWLDANGFPHAQVIISSNKGDTCRRIGVTHYIDDKNENCLDVFNKNPGLRVVMYAQPWNQEQPGIMRIDKLGTFLDLIAIAQEANNVGR